MSEYSFGAGRGLRGALLSALVATLLAGCALTPAVDEDEVVERAKARWDAVLAGDYETAYPFYTPGFRSSTSLVDYAVSLRTRRVNGTSAEYQGHECGEDRCTVRFLIGYRVFAPVPGMTTYDGKQAIEDTWIRTGGEWWYLPPKD
ncbi:MAG: hypothetical protein P8Y54_12600 [Xanthomonadales bacterium]